MASAAQCLQPANMAAHVGLRVAADPLHFGTGGFQMGAGVIDTKTRSGLLPSIPQRAGRGTFLPRSRTDFATAVICNGVNVPFFLHDFVDGYEGRYRDYQLPLPIRLV